MQKRYTIISCRVLLFILVSIACYNKSYSQLKADFSVSPTEGCTPMIVNFKDSSSGNPTSWKWDLGNGTISYLQNPGATYFNPGKYTVTLEVSDGVSISKIVKTNIIIVHGAPAISFQASDTTGCYPLDVQFRDLTIATDDPITQWEWFFGDGGYSTDHNPLHTYKTTGSFDVTLRVTTSYGCENAFTRIGFIKVPKGVTADFTYNNPGSCTPPTTIQFTNKSTGTGQFTYLWRFGDGGTSSQPNPSHTYETSGDYTVTLVVNSSQGCVDSIVKQKAVSIGSVQADFNAPDSVCAGTPVQLTNQSTPPPVSVVWDFGDGTKSTELNPVKTYANPGTYVIQLTSNFGACSGVDRKAIKVLARPKSNFTATDNIGCNVPLSVNFTATSTNATSYKWIFGDGTESTDASPTHVYTKLDTFDVTLISFGPNGCPDTVVKNNFVNISKASVVMKDSSVSGCAPLTYKPSVTITGPYPVNSIQWDFGDGTRGTGASPTHVYNDTGRYTVRVIYAGPNCTDSVEFTSAVLVGMKPTPDFDAAPRSTCAWVPVQFTDKSSGPPIDTWLWDFGDHSPTSPVQNPKHAYQEVGDFNVTLTVSHNGCSNTLTLPKFVHIDPPISIFTISQQCTFPYVRRFVDKSIQPETWLWDFGDGQTSTEQNPQHSYDKPGVYTVSLTVTHGTCSHTSRQDVKVVDEKNDFISTDSVTCKKNQVKFNTVGVNQNNIAQYAWTFGDGFTSILPSPEKIYTKAGSYDVSLTLTDVLGCKSTLLKPLYIKVQGPTPDFSVPVSGVCNNTTVTFKDESSGDGDNPILQWKWDFGDGTIQSFTAPPFSHLYTKPGNYNITLITTDSQGCTDTVTKKNALLVSQPVANFRARDSLLCASTKAEFNNLSTGPQLTYLWDFGDGSTGTDGFPIHSYPNEGAYTVSLKITDVYGCSDSLKKVNYINIRNPIAKFTANSTLAECPPLVASFNNQSQNYQSVAWTFGTGDASTMVSPIYIYSYPGKYKVKLIVKGYGDACFAADSTEITVLGPKGTFKYDPLKGCDPLTVNFTALPEPGFKVKLVWDFADGTLINNGDSLTTHTYLTASDYLPKMILIDDKGCRVPVTGKDTISVYGTDAAFTHETKPLCDSGFVKFTDASQANDVITQYKWDFGDGSFSNEKNPSHFYRAHGSYPVKLYTLTENNCRDTSQQTAIVTVNIGPDISMQSIDSACVPVTVLFKANSAIDTMQLAWAWNFGNGQTSNVQNPPAVVYNSPNTYNVQVVATNRAGCYDTAKKALPVYPLPNINAGNDTAMCLGTSITLHATGGIDYNWQPTQTLSCGNCIAPVASPKTTIKYFLTGKDIHGCVNTDDINVEVKQIITVKVSPNDTLCVGASQQLNATGAELYAWTPVDGLSNPQISNPVARPNQTVTYQVIGTDNKACFNDTGYVTITVFPIPKVNAGNDTTISVGNSVTLHAEVSDDVTSIVWTPSTALSCVTCKDPVSNPKQTTNYTITATNNGGCYTMDQVVITVICKNGNIFLPNTFSPNNDGVNDIFYPRGKGLYNIRSLKIFNRWGQVVFSRESFNANEADKGWDGMFQGKIADEGVYIYMIEVICENSQIIIEKGNVALIR
ncbi:PKD domain-containing protein [Pinibacter aurantiacus]|nr:PKD domain-containing protein [Pinibacter aurantiacus]